MNTAHLITQLAFQHKNVWVTGAGSGIGLAIAQGFAQLGAYVIGLDKAFTVAPICRTTGKWLERLDRRDGVLGEPSPKIHPLS